MNFARNEGLNYMLIFMRTQTCEQETLPYDYHNIMCPSEGESRRVDQEMGSSSTTNVNDPSEDDIKVFCLTCSRDLNPVRVIFAELLGTFILMFSVCGIIASTQLMRGEVGLLEYAATGGLTIIVLIFSIGPISGAHVNPSVTVAFATFGQLPWPRVPFYIMAQIVGSIFGTYVGKSVYNIETELMITRPLNGRKSAFWAELMGTFIIMFLATSISSEPHVGGGHASGFVVGVAIALSILITMPVSGGSLNPIRSLGPAIISWRFDDVWLYILAPTVGAILGVFVHRTLRLQRQSS